MVPRGFGPSPPESTTVGLDSIPQPYPYCSLITGVGGWVMKDWRSCPDAIWSVCVTVEAVCRLNSSGHVVFLTGICPSGRRCSFVILC